MKNPYIYNRVSDLILTRDFTRPIHSSSIENMLNVAGPTVRDIVRTMRRQGEPVIATEAGYYMATRPEEVQIVIRDLQSRIASMSKTVAAIKTKASERFGYQSSFDFGRAGAEVQGPVEGGAAEAPGRSACESEGREVLHVQADRGENKPEHIREGSADAAFDALLLEELISV